MHSSQLSVQFVIFKVLGRLTQINIYIYWPSRLSKIMCSFIITHEVSLGSYFAELIILTLSFSLNLFLVILV